MIPLSLKLHNFMSYEDLDLDLSGVHLAVLTGANGSGKSSLLDAITYALWDKARAGAESLIRLGQSEMWVELVFALEHETYRIWRRRLKKTTAQSQLEFHQLVGGDPRDPEAWVSLTGTTIRETQARITAVVKMEYDTFVNSAFILQGRADAFTTKTPRERKAVLADILGLQAYDALASRARDKWKAAQSRADALEADQSDLRARVAERPTIEAALARTREGLQDLALRGERAETRQNRLLSEEQTLRGAEAQLDALATTKTHAAVERERLDGEIAGHRRELEAARAEGQRREEIERRYARWEALQAEDAALRKLQERYRALERELADRVRDRQDAAHRRDLELRTLDAELQGLEAERESHAGVLKERARIETGMTRLAEARRDEALHMEKAQAARVLLERRAALASERERLKLRAEADRQDRERRRARAQDEAAALPALLEEIQALETRLAGLAILAVEQDRVKEKGFTFRARKEAAELSITAARDQIRQRNAKLAQLEVNLEVHAGGKTIVKVPRSHACPLCETPLSEADLTKIQGGYLAEIAGFEDEIVRYEHELTKLDHELLASRARWAEIERELKGREAAQKLLGELVARRTQLDAARADVATLDRELAQPIAIGLPPAAEAEWQAIETDLAALAYDPAELAVLQAKIADYRWAESRHWQLEQALGAIERIEARLPELVARRTGISTDADTAEGTLAAAIAALEAELATLGYDAAAHTALQTELEALGEAPKAWSELQKRLLWLEGAETLLARLEAEQAQHALRVAECETGILAAQRTLERLPLWEAERAALQIEIKHLRDEEALRHGEIGRLEAELARIAEQERELAAKATGWNEAIADAQTFKELATAFGKDGIQAIIIENAIPELEEEANRLLARMTDNRMHVRLATQKEKKTGGVNETLEIYISDEVGTRNYELYSGGESFRVNFALRLALSRLLARRAGAKLQTLVIDEGFGTQDDKGREKLIEAINAVSDEFARILVITHIRELKDAFNTQIEVVKRGGLSEVRLVG